MTSQDTERAKLLDHIWKMIDYWEREAHAATPRAKLEGLAFSFLVMLDGESANLPPYQVVPGRAVDDGRAWDWRGQPDIAGGLHDAFSMQRAGRRASLTGAGVAR